jgi:hypothetical protein
MPWLHNPAALLGMCPAVGSAPGKKPTLIAAVLKEHGAAAGAFLQPFLCQQLLLTFSDVVH